ncbi:hypothetical protein HK405_014905, partial [Cladochytrium tenue]
MADPSDITNNTPTTAGGLATAAATTPVHRPQRLDSEVVLPPSAATTTVPVVPENDAGGFGDEDDAIAAGAADATDAATDGPPVDRVVVVAVDDSDNSNHAISWALHHILRRSDLCVLLHARPAATSPGPYGGMYSDLADLAAAAEEQQRTESHTLLRAYMRRIRKANIACRAIALSGDARSEIARKVDELRADLLVIGSRGHGLLRRALLGSVSD